MPESPIRNLVVKAATDFGYRVEQSPTANEAIDTMRFINYAAVFLHTSFESGGIKSGEFHRFMREMNMSRRRYIFFVELRIMYAIRSYYDVIGSSSGRSNLSILIPRSGLIKGKAFS